MSKSLYSNQYSLDLYRFVRQYRAYGGHACLFSNSNNQYVIGFMFSTDDQPVAYIKRTSPESENESVEIGYIKITTVGNTTTVLYHPLETFNDLRPRVLQAQNIIDSIKINSPGVELTAEEAKAACYFAGEPQMLVDWAAENDLYPYYTILKETDENGKRKKFIHLLRDGAP
ncbi:MAG: hypothetical protein IJ571_00140 [Ruminococcus sp.]|nr:hypothetical protein [Ruminococcus sp.]